MPDFVFILQVDYDFRFTRQCPNETTAVRRRDLLWRPQPNVGLVDVRRSFVNYIDHRGDVVVDDKLAGFFLAPFEGVIEENVRFQLVVVLVHNLRKKLSVTSKSIDLTVKQGIP